MSYHNDRLKLGFIIFVIAFVIALVMELFKLL